MCGIHEKQFIKRYNTSWHHKSINWAVVSGKSITTCVGRIASPRYLARLYCPIYKSVCVCVFVRLFPVFFTIKCAAVQVFFLYAKVTREVYEVIYSSHMICVLFQSAAWIIVLTLKAKTALIISWLLGVKECSP